MATRGYVTSRFTLELDGEPAGTLAAVAGGDAVSDVIEERFGPGQPVRKHLAGVRYQDIEIACTADMSEIFFEWIRAALDRRYQRRSGVIVTVDFDGREQARLEFANALLTEIIFPALDGASKDTARMTAKLTSEFTRRTKQKERGPRYLATAAAGQKKWLSSNFRLRIDGLDCSRVTKIESLTIRQTVVADAVGERRDYQQEPVALEIPDLVVTLSESNSDSFYRWHEDFVVHGNSTERHEKSGTLEFLSPNMIDVLFTLTFNGLGIYKLAPQKVEAGTDGVRRVEARMYCEEIHFDTRGAQAAAISRV